MMYITETESLLRNSIGDDMTTRNAQLQGYRTVCIAIPKWSLCRSVVSGDITLVVAILILDEETSLKQYIPRQFTKILFFKKFVANASLIVS